jgi:PAS domain S-box-containing protein
LNEEQLPELQRINRALELKNYCNITVLLADNENILLEEFCNVLSELGGYKLVWIAYLEENKVTTKAISKSGHNCNNVKEMIESESEKISFVISDEKYAKYSVKGEDNSTSDKLKKCGFASSIYFPIKGLEDVNGICTIYSDKDDEFDLDEIQNISDMLMLLVFGVDALRTKERRYKAEKELLNEKEELSVTLKSLSEGVVTTNLQGKITLMNRAAEEILEVNESLLAGHYIFTVLPSTNIYDKGSEDAFYINDYKKFKEGKNSQIPYKTKSGTNKIISIEGNEIRDTYANIKGFVFVLLDDTERIKIENQLALSQKMESIGHLAAGIAHEINTPMQYIGDNTLFINDSLKMIFDYSDYLESVVLKNQQCDTNELDTMKEKYDIEFLKEELPQAIEQAQSGIKQVSKIVSAMKDFSHPSQEARNYADINKCVKVTSTITKNVWKYVSDLVTDLREDLPNVYCIIDEIKQVILNMIVNAAQAIEDRNGSNSDIKGEIKIATYEKDNYCFIKISDTGIGISKENLAKIFYPFFTTKEVGRGTGQGLSIVHDIIVNKHNGEILVDSEIGQGTIFTIKLPVLKPGDEPDNFN